MANHAQNTGQVFATQFPYVDQGSPRPAYPPPYTTVPQQQNTSTCTCTSGICKSIFAGRISTFWLGSVLLVSGAMSQAGAAVAFGYFAGLSKIGAGIWCGYMFMTGGAVAIAVGHHETRNLIIGTIVTSALAVVASITLLAIAGTGLANDNGNGYSCYPWCDFYPYPQYCPCFYEDWKGTAMAANGVIVGAAALALVAGVWLLVVVCIAIRRNPASFQGVSVPAESIANAVLRNFYEDIPLQRQAYSGPVQHVQQPHQQPISFSHLPSDTAYQPTLSQVMQMPSSYSPLQTNSNQQVFQVPVQFILNIPQPNAPEEIRNQQMLSIPVQYLLQQQQYQQQIPLNYLQPNSIAPSTLPPQEQENHALTQADADDAVTALES